MIRKLIERLKKGPTYRYRSAVTGRFVTKLYAMLYPNETYRVKVR